jgi:tetratricopeptide (TPR) repeat protein
MSDQTSSLLFATEDPRLTAARAGFDAVQGDTAAARQQLESVVAQNGAPIEALVVAQWGLGRLSHNAGEFEAAVRHFENAIAMAERVGQLVDAAGVRVSAAVTFQTVGDVKRALAELDLAEPYADRDTVGRLAGQRALVLLNLGRPLDAIRDFDRAITHLTLVDDRIALARTHLNRGVAHLQRSATTIARKDLVLAHQLASSVGETVVAAAALHNLGYLDGRRGDFPAALRSFEDARETYLHLGSPWRLLAGLDIDHCGALLEVGLAPEALEIADRLIDELTRSGDVLQLGEARLLRARALIIMRDFEPGAIEATAAEALLRANGRESWATVAAYLGAFAASRSATLVDDELLLQPKSLADLAARLDEFGWRAEAAEVRTMYGRMAIDRGDLDEARRQLLLASRASRSASVDMRAVALAAKALVHLADGDSRAALIAARRGLDAVDRRRASFGSSELRVAASAVGVPLVDIGLRVALERRSPSAVLRWAERGRAVAMALTPTSPSDDPMIAATMAELRELHLARENAPDADAKIADAERRVLRLRRLDHGDLRRHQSLQSTSSLAHELGGDALVEFVESDHVLHAVVVRGGRSKLVTLCSSDAAATAVDHLLFAIRRLSTMTESDRRVANAVAALAHSARAVEAMLLGPLRLGRTGGVVVVPTGRLHLLPWSALPGMHGRDVTIAPSASRWLDGALAERTPTAGVSLVAGPQLQHAPTEIAQLAKLYRDPRTLAGGNATVAATISQIEGASIAHIAAHGSFRADSPMFSALHLADGPLSIHDLEHLRRPPRLVVLTACDAGRNAVLAGDELLGTAAALLSIGVGTVIAPLLPIPDHATAPFAVALHRQLVAGSSPAAALAEAAAATRSTGLPADIAVASSFQCVGTGDSRVSRIL